jgi:fatty acid desaturase
MADFNPPRPIPWYRTPLASADFKSLHQRSDWLGALQTGGYLGVLTLTGTAAFLAAGRLPIPVVLLLILLHGMMYAFLINAVHELVHGTVFRTRFLNAFFLRVFAFLAKNNFRMIEESHARHHRYTLHQPDDLEVVLPAGQVLLKHFLLTGIINPMAVWPSFSSTIRFARDRFEGEWELTLFPPGSPARRATVRWARILLAGHGLILVVSLYFHLWLIPVLITLGPFYGGWLQSACNGTQHVGLQDDVSDFRLCCRSFTINPVLQFLYWHMNYHIEHHMYAAVPCYRLGRLHRLIQHDLAPCPHGVIETWKEIAAIQKIQQTNPAYEHVALLPGTYAPANVNLIPANGP